MVFILGLLTVIAVLASILLMFVILLQEPKGGGLAAALGGSGMDAIGANVGQVNRFTATVAGVWIGACLLHSILQPVGVEFTRAPAGSGPPSSGNPSVTEPPVEKSQGGAPREGTK